MKLEFKFVDKEHIEVIATHNKETKKVGDIFTPSGSGEDTKNSIQVCGFNEAYDLWGCAKYETFKLKEGGVEYEFVKAKTYSLAPSILDVFEPDIRNKIMETIRNDNMKAFERVKDKKVMVNLKDIQLRFPYPSESFETERSTMNGDCYGCFNNPCTCENKGKHRNPYDVKRETDLDLEKKKRAK